MIKGGDPPVPVTEALLLPTAPVPHPMATTASAATFADRGQRAREGVSERVSDKSEQYVHTQIAGGCYWVQQQNRVFMNVYVYIYVHGERVYI